MAWQTSASAFSATRAFQRQRSRLVVPPSPVQRRFAVWSRSSSSSSSSSSGSSPPGSDPSNDGTVAVVVVREQRDVITSTRSTTVKKVQALRSRSKKRQELRQTLVEGPRMIRDLIKNDRTKHLVRQVLIDTDKWEVHYEQLLRPYLQQQQHLQQQQQQNDNYQIIVQPATSDVLSACTDTVTNQGIVAVVDIPDPGERLLAGGRPADDAFPPPLYLVLDAMADPGNVGTLVRSAVAVGVAAVFLLPGSSDPWNPKAIRSAMGTTFQLPVLTTVNSWHDCLERLQTLRCKRVWAATMLNDDYDDDNNDDDDNRSFCYDEVDWMEASSALVIGSEGNGLTHDVRASIGQQYQRNSDDPDHRLPPVKAVHVPMQAGIESLNAAVCGSVLLFEYRRQARRRGAKTAGHG